MVVGVVLVLVLALPSHSQAQYGPPHYGTPPQTYPGAPPDFALAVGTLILGPPILATHILTAVNLGQVLGSRTYFDRAGAIGELVFSSLGMLALIGPAWELGRAPQDTPDWVWAITASTAMSVTWNFTHAILSLAMPRARPLPVEVGISPGGFQLRGHF